MRRVLWLALCIGFFGNSLEAAKGRRKDDQNLLLTQIQAFNCDFDDNIGTTDATIVVTHVTTGNEVEVSTANWALVKTQLGKPGKWKDYKLGSDGLRNFGDTGPEGDELYANQIRRALKESPAKFKGPSFNAFVKALSDPATRKHTTIITARLHSPTAIMKGMRVLLDAGLIPALPLIENIFCVAWPGFDPALKGATHAESKANVMKMLLDRIEAEPVPADAALVENREGTGQERLHLWGFSDDDYENFSKAQEALSAEVAKGRWKHIKIVLYFTGQNNPQQKPRAVVITSEGGERPVKDFEATRMALPHAVCGATIVESTAGH